MATYLELAEIENEAGWGDLLNKIRQAAAIKAAAVIDSTPPPGDVVLAWATSAVANKNQAGDDLAGYVVAKNEASAIAVILVAGDGTIQTNIDAAVDKIYGV